MPVQRPPSSTPREAPIQDTARAKWELDGLTTTDNHRLTAVFSCSLRRLSDPTEQKFFAETFLTNTSAVSIDQILAHFKPSLLSVATKLASATTAADALNLAVHSNWIDSLKSAAGTIAFSCGIELLPPFAIELSSPSLQREQREQMQRAAVQRTAAQRMEHFQRAADLLRQWDSLKAASPQVSAGRLIEQLNPTDRGEMLQTLLMASAQQSNQADLWAVAGSQAIQINFDGETASPKLVPLPTTAGPLRSVRMIDGNVIAGAQKGVIVFAPQTPNDALVYLDPGLISEHGFTHLAMNEQAIIACHRDGGIVRWNRNQPDRPAAAVRPSQLSGAPKFLVSCGGSQHLFAMGEQLLKFGPDDVITPVRSFDSPIVSLLNLADQIIAVTENGAVTALDSHTLEIISTRSLGGQVSGAAILPWLTTARILLNRPDGSVQCIGLDDQLLTQFTSSFLGLRTVVGSNGKVAAMTSDRQRIVYWDTWESRTPAGEIHLTSLVRHRIADIAFG